MAKFPLQVRHGTAVRRFFQAVRGLVSRGSDRLRYGAAAFLPDSVLHSYGGRDPFDTDLHLGRTGLFASNGTPPPSYNRQNVHLELGLGPIPQHLRQSNDIARRQHGTRNVGRDILGRVADVLNAGEVLLRLALEHAFKKEVSAAQCQFQNEHCQFEQCHDGTASVRIPEFPPDRFHCLVVSRLLEYDAEGVRSTLGGEGEGRGGGECESFGEGGGQSVPPRPSKGSV
mmetsp:Transcript_41489/g.125692  ORF Transcript_41489/g.125692 Transcript_41489/m.125692 type:complete len:228 (+) Transcript_41489:971-1654(+)